MNLLSSPGLQLPREYDTIVCFLPVAWLFSVMLTIPPSKDCILPEARCPVKCVYTWIQARIFVR